MIKLEHVSKAYSAGIPALNDVNLEIDDGEFVFVCGDSGSGKSTLIKLLLKELDPTDGTITVDGRNLTRIRHKQIPKYRRNVGVVFQDFRLLKDRNVYENVAFALRHSKLSNEEKDKKIRGLLELVDLADRAENYPAQLSGGQKQRVAIARALANDPEILISDESTSALDPKTTKQILSLLQDLNKKLGLTVVMITHEMQIVKDICNRVAVMQNGQLLEEGSVLDIFSNPQEDLTQEFIETAAGIEDALAKINAQPLVKNLPASALLVQLKYVGSSTDRPLLTEIFKDFGVSGNILYGNVEILGDTPVGELVVVLDGDSDKVIAALKAIENAGVSLQVLKKGAQ